MKTEKFPVTIVEKGVSAVIRKVAKSKGGKTHNYFIVEYILLGKRKQVWRSDLDEAKTTAQEACLKIANGVQSSIELRDTDRMAYVRAVEALSSVDVPIDTACREYADALQILGGKASIAEACREWVKRNAVILPKITIEDANRLLQRQIITDGKSKWRQKQIAAALDRYVDAQNQHGAKQLADYLTALRFKERT